MNFKRVLLTSTILSSLVLAACGNTTGGQASSSSENPPNEQEGISGQVLVDGSSTVFPILEAVAEEYSIANPDVKATIGVSGTGGGFEKFIAGETDISNASRPIKEEEVAALDQAGIDYTEVKLALDGLSVVVNQSNDWVDQLTIEELSKMWLESGNVKTWADVREGWPNEEIKFFSPGTDSGTFDYFDEVVLDGEQMRKDAALSEDDNILVQGVTGTPNGIGFFGYAYYLENKDKLKIVPIVNSAGKAVAPDANTVQSGEYEPLSRPLFIYVKHDSLKNNPAVYDFTAYTLEHAGEMAEAVGYVALAEEEYSKALEEINTAAGK